MRTYDTLFKDRLLVERELAQLQEASQITVDKALGWLLARMAPAGPIMERRDLSLIYKTVAALALLERQEEVMKLLDWTAANAVASNGDLYFEGDESSAGVYRQSWLLRNAALAGHALADAETVAARMRQYQGPDGGVREMLGEDPDAPDPSPGYTLAATCGFGLYAVAAGDAEAARATGDFMRRLVEQNRPDMERGEFFFTSDEDGNANREIPKGGDFGQVVRVDASMQPTWVLGLAMAFFAELHDSGLVPDTDAYLDAAAELTGFQDRMPLETYFSWNACKLAWSSGRLLDVCIRHGYGDIELYDQLYRAGRLTYIHTFLGTRRADGAWGYDFYPLSSDAPETQIDQRVFEGISGAPEPEAWAEHRAPDPVVAIDPIEISGENLVMLLHLRRGVDTLRAHLGSVGADTRTGAAG